MVSLFHDTTSYGRGIREELENSAPSAGLQMDTIVSAEPPQDGTTSFGTDLTLALSALMRGDS
eukprot:4426505-Prymnesium_polylepis.1